MDQGWMVALFLLGYLVIIFEERIKINKTAVALLLAVFCWSGYFLFGDVSTSQETLKLAKHVADVAQILFFLMGAMTLVELIDAHRGFKLITDIIQVTSKRKMLWVIALVSFFLSAVLDNLTTTILMVSLLRKLVPDFKERFPLLCLVVVAANAGGAWTPIGDVTTTMLWIGGQLTSINVMRALCIPSLVSLLVPLCIFTFQTQGRHHFAPRKSSVENEEPGGRLVFFLGLGALIFVPIFKTVTGLPPFMGILLGLGILWLITDILHYPYEQRKHLRIPYILTRIDTSGILFFLGILLAVNALETIGVLESFARILSHHIASVPLLATFIGLISAVIDNVPLVAATRGMYSLEQFPIDTPLWHLIAYAAGTGGSLLILGSSAGIALMGMEKVSFAAYLKKATFPVLLGYLGGMASYLLTCGFLL